MKNCIFLITLLLLTGCNTTGPGDDAGDKVKTYIAEPKYFIKDPHYEEFGSKKGDLEERYLNKEITYGEYMEKKEELTDDYDQEVEDRNSKTIFPE